MWSEIMKILTEIGGVAVPIAAIGWMVKTCVEYYLSKKSKRADKDDQKELFRYQNLKEKELDIIMEFYGKLSYLHTALRFRVIIKGLQDQNVNNFFMDAYVWFEKAKLYLSEIMKNNVTKYLNSASVLCSDDVCSEEESRLFRILDAEFVVIQQCLEKLLDTSNDDNINDNAITVDDKDLKHKFKNRRVYKDALKKYSNMNLFLDNIVQSLIKLTSNKNNIILSNICNNEYNSTQSLNELLNEVILLITRLSGFKKDELGVKLAYSLDEKIWKWFGGEIVSLSSDTIAKNYIDSDVSFEFVDDVNKNMDCFYCDAFENSIGSIIAKKVIVKNDCFSLSYVIMIETYHKCFTVDNDRELVNNIAYNSKNLLDCFEPYITSELLSLSYLKYPEVHTNVEGV